MERETVILLRNKFEEAGIKKYTIEFNNNFVIGVGHENRAVIFDDENGVLWEVGPKNNGINDQGTKAVIRAFCYDEIQFFRAGVSTLKDGMNLLEASGCEITTEVTDVLNKLIGSSNGLYPIQSYPDTDKDGKPIMYGSMPSCRPGL